MNKSKASHNLYDLSGLLISQMSPLSQRLCDCWYPPVKRVPVHIKKERQRGGRPSLNWRTFVAPDWTWKSNDITNKSRRLSDKEPLKSRSGKKVTFLHCWCTTGMSNLKVLDNLIKFKKKKKKKVSVCLQAALKHGEDFEKLSMWPSRASVITIFLPRLSQGIRFIVIISD